MAGVPTPATDANGNTYDWIVFSSIRGAGSKAQLYVAGVVQDATGAVQTYAAVRPRNQDPTANNLIPSWGEFAIGPGTVLPPM